MTAGLNRRTILSGTLGVALMWCVGVGLAGCERSQPEVKPPLPPTVTVQSPERDTVTIYAESPGRFAATDSTGVRARVDGFVDEIHFVDGEFVEIDKPLFTIERDRYESAVKRAEATLASAKAALGLADATLQRLTRAAKTGAVSQLDVLEAQAKKDDAEANVDAAQTALADAKLNLSYTEVKAPFSGRVSESAVSRGAYVRAGGQDVLATMTALDPIYCYFNASERGVLAYQQRGKSIPRAESHEQIPEDQRIYVKLKLADGSIYEHDGFIDYASPEIDPLTGTLRVRVRVPNPDNLLYPGQFARVMLTQFEGEAVLVPEVAVVRDAVGPHLLAVGVDDKVVRQDVKLGALLDGRRVILEGIQPGDRVITAGVQRARVGMPVDPQSPVKLNPTEPEQPDDSEKPDGNLAE